jgi:hypothetical protein
VLAFLDDIWLACARELDLPVQRGGDAYVHFDGHTLHIADPQHLDADDSVAQLVLHEICHALVQGPAQRHDSDWGLDNTGAETFDEVRERAAVRLQAHLCESHGLRPHLFPTTVVRPFFEALPREPIAIAAHDDGSIALARAAATRAGKAPYARALARALHASAAALSIEHHRSGAVRREGARCGDCVWRRASGLCRAADEKIFVAPDEIACARHEAKLDCLECGACCRSGYDAVPVRRREAVVTRHPALLVVRDGGHDLRRADVDGENRCVALAGVGPHRCSIYADRPRACADLPAGGAACLTARRRVGLSLA